MRLSYALRVLFSNFRLVYKTVIYRLLLFILSCLCIYYWFSASLRQIFADQGVISLFENIGIIFKNFSDIETVSATMQTIAKENIPKIWELITLSQKEIITSVAGIVLIVYIYKCLLGVCDYVVGKLEDMKMSSMTEFAFWPTFMMNFVKAFFFQLFNCFMQLIYNGICILAIVGLYIWLSGLLSVLVVPVLLVFIVLASALRLTVFSQLMPSYILDDKGLSYAFEKTLTFKKGNFGKLYGIYVSFIIVSYSINALMVIISLGTGLIFTLPMTAVLSVSIQLSTYYNFNNRKYYIDFDHIVVPKELRENDEQLLNLHFE